MFIFFFQAEDGIRDHCVTGVQTCALPICVSCQVLSIQGELLTTAEALLRQKLTLDAQYLAGYTVECSLKALILHLSPSRSEERRVGKVCRFHSMRDWYKINAMSIVDCFIC